MPGQTRHPLSRLETQRGLRISIWEGSFATVFALLTSNSVFLTGFALMLGASNTQIGLLAGIGALSALTQLACPYFAARTNSRRRLCLLTSYPARFLWIPILLIPFLHLGHEASVWLLIILFALSMGFLSFASPAWTTWMAELVPEDARGRFFSRRNLIMGLAGIIATLASGFYKDAVSDAGGVSQALSFAMVFSVGLAFAALGYLALALQPEPPPKPEPPVSPLELLRIPLRDAAFRRLAFYFFFWVIAVTIPGPYFAVYMIKNLGLSYGEMNFLAVVTQAGGLASLTAWGYLSDKFGNRPIIVICSALAVTLPLPWLLATPHNAVLVLSLLNTVSGAVWYGLGLAQFNLILGIEAENQRSAYIASVSAVVGLGNFLGPMIGAGILKLLAAILKLIHDHQFNLFGSPMAPMEVLFMCGTAARFLSCVFTLRGIREPKSHPTGYVLQQIASADPLRTAIHLHRARSVADPEKRANSMKKLGSMGAALAVDEMILALEDSSLAVRRETTRALARIRDERSVPALGAALHSPALGISEQAARALGAIGSPTALPYLRDAMTHPHMPTRAAAIRSLGEIGDIRSIPIVLDALDAARQERQPETAEAACDAITDIGLSGTYLVIVDALGDPEPRIRAAAARTLAELAGTNARSELRSAIQRETDELNISVLCDAISTIGTVDDLDVLYQVLRNSDSPALRRQAAHAMAALMAPRAEAYGLFAVSADLRQAALKRFLSGLKPADLADAGLSSTEEALDAYLSGDYTTLVQWVLTTLRPEPSGPQGILANEISHHTLSICSEEEAMLCLVAAVLGMRGKLEP